MYVISDSFASPPSEMGRTNVEVEETEATYANAGTNTGHAGLGDNSKMRRS